MDLHLCSIPFENLEVFDEGRIPSLRGRKIFYRRSLSENEADIALS